MLVFIFSTFSSIGLAEAYRYTVYSLLILAGFVIYTMRSSLWHLDLLHLDGFRCAQLTLRQMLHVAAPLFLFLVAAKDMGISRTFLFSYCSLLACCLFLTNRRLPNALANLCFRGRRQQRTLLCGMPEDFARVEPWLHRKTSFGMQVCGFAALQSGTGTLPNGARWESVDDLEAILAREKINQVVLTRTLTAEGLQALSARCDTAGSRIFILHDLEEQLGRPVRFIRDEGLNFITLREEPLECPLNRLTKRMLDVGIALPVVLFV
ncbi:MAG: hypothetical protein EOP83_33060, partial [Verrucomicrobiaceae bacterium]